MLTVNFESRSGCQPNYHLIKGEMESKQRIITLGQFGKYIILRSRAFFRGRRRVLENTDIFYQAVIRGEGYMYEDTTYHVLKRFGVVPLERRDQHHGQLPEAHS
jgi:hypothetical protein